MIGLIGPCYFWATSVSGSRVLPFRSPVPAKRSSTPEAQQFDEKCNVQISHVVVK